MTIARDDGARTGRAGPRATTKLQPKAHRHFSREHSAFVAATRTAKFYMVHACRARVQRAWLDARLAPVIYDFYDALVTSPMTGPDVLQLEKAARPTVHGCCAPVAFRAPARLGVFNESGYVTASMLYDLESCEHRPWMDRHADRASRDYVSPFVDMLWRHGRAHEEEAIAAEGVGDVLDLRKEPLAERERLTTEAMDRGERVIFGGRIRADDLLGEPDILRLAPGGGYVPGDIKSGAGEEGPPGTDRRLKVHYGVQLALYVDVLERQGRSTGRCAFVWDIKGEEVAYDLTVPRGQRSPSLWETYQADLAMARAIVAGTVDSRPAYSGTCKQCWWLTACLDELERADDLTLIHELGRSRRDPLSLHAATITEFAAMSAQSLLNDKGKSVVKGFSPESLIKFRARAILRVSNGDPYLKSPPVLPHRDVELFFDIETDPMRDHCYLHGFVERRGGDNATERFVGFFSEEPTLAGERIAFARAWHYVQSSAPCAIYIYSKYERTWWRALQERFPDVCSKGDLEALFGGPDMVDLYDVVSEHTEWPTRDYSLKTLAKFLGFEWRDTHPSGAASIEWYDRFLAGDPDARERILAYNEDDCRATRVLLDGIRNLYPAS